MTQYFLCSHIITDALGKLCAGHRDKALIHEAFRVNTLPTSAAVPDRNIDFSTLKVRMTIVDCDVYPQLMAADLTEFETTQTW
jgi:hypothetical protein